MRRRPIWRASLAAGAAAGLGLSLLTLPRAAAPPAQAAGQAARFDAASVTRADPNSRMGICNFKTSDPAQFSVFNCSLRYFVMQAYGLEAYQIDGSAVKWIDANIFDIRASMSGSPDHARQVKMLRALLAERFQLKVHKGTRRGEVYALTVAQGGAKLTPAKDGAKTPFVSTFREGDTRAAAISVGYAGTNATMAMLATRLAQGLRAPVQERTGLDGHYDFRVNFTESGQDPGLYPPLPRALQHDLGLKLSASKGLVPILIVDHAEKPSAN